MVDKTNQTRVDKTNVNPGSESLPLCEAAERLTSDWDNNDTSQNKEIALPSSTINELDQNGSKANLGQEIPQQESAADVSAEDDARTKGSDSKGVSFITKMRGAFFLGCSSAASKKVKRLKEAFGSAMATIKAIFPPITQCGFLFLGINWGRFTARIEIMAQSAISTSKLYQASFELYASFKAKIECDASKESGRQKASLKGKYINFAKTLKPKPSSRGPKKPDQQRPDVVKSSDWLLKFRIVVDLLFKLTMIISSLSPIIESLILR